MEISAVITAVVVIGVVWGGFVFFVARAVKFEKKKNNINDKL